MGFEQRNLVVGVLHHLHHLFVVEEFDLARLWVDAALHREVGEFALGGLHHGIRDHLGDGFLVQPLFAGDFVDDFQQVVRQICLCVLKFGLKVGLGNVFVIQVKQQVAFFWAKLNALCGRAF